ncbi:MAG: hypothetical protein ACXWC4_04950 [Telluria sp.]
MRNAFILLATLLLAGCVDEAASYSDANDRTLVMHAEQEHFWDRALSLQLVAANLPDCQRQFALGKLPAERVDIMLYANGNGVFTLQSGNQMWRVETNTCGELAAPSAPSGQPLGSFRMLGERLMFVQAGTTTVALR